MEFIIIVLGLAAAHWSGVMIGYYYGEKHANKKFQHPDESPKVSTNEDKKKICAYPARFKKCPANVHDKCCAICPFYVSISDLSDPSKGH